VTWSLPRASRAQENTLCLGSGLFPGERVTWSLPGASWGVLYGVWREECRFVKARQKEEGLIATTTSPPLRRTDPLVWSKTNTQKI